MPQKAPRSARGRQIKGLAGRRIKESVKMGISFCHVAKIKHKSQELREAKRLINQ